MRTMIRTAVAVVGMAAMTSGVGCGGRVTVDEGAGQQRAALRRAASCEDLQAMLTADAIAKVNARVDEQIAEVRAWGPYGGPSYGGQPNGTGGAMGFPGDESGSAGAGTTEPPRDSAKAQSDTNTQVAGVDEADIVKTDGKHLFLLHGQTLQIIDAWPAASLAKGSEISIEGQPSEMFVHDGRAVVYSAVDGASVYEAANVTPKPQYDEYGYGYGGGAVDVGMGGMGGGYNGSQAPLTKVTVLRVDGAAPTIEAELYFEGNYLSSRRVGAEIRTVLEGGAHGPSLPGYPEWSGAGTTSEAIAAWERLRQTSIAAIRASKVSDWLPYTFVKRGDQVTASLARCDGYYVPTAGTTSYGLTQVQVLDETAPNDVRGVSIVGAAETVYSNASTMIVAAASYEAAAYASAWASRTTTAIPTARTHLHKFDLAANPGEPRYVASGTVVGTVNNQFSLDERDGYLRVATTEDRMFLGGSGGGDVPVGTGTAPSNPGVPSGGGGSGGGIAQDGGAADPAPPDPTPAPAPAPAPNSGPGSRPLDAPLGPSRVNHLFVLAEQDGELAVVGSAGELAPEERIYSARFVGNRGYLVTFRQVDPLFVIDLSVPTAPKVVGELKIPGFSEYMHPLDDGHLLTIGKDTTEDEWGGVQTNGLALQIFDVRQASAPRLLHKYVFSDPYGSSEASYDHKAFTYFADRKLLAFPYSSYDDMRGMKSSLEVFSIDTEAGIARLGSIDHSSLMSSAPQGYCSGYYGVDVRRGLFLDDYVYSISYGGVVVNQVNDLDHPVASLALSAPEGPAEYCAYGE